LYSSLRIYGGAWQCYVPRVEGNRISAVRQSVAIATLHHHELYILRRSLNIFPIAGTDDDGNDTGSTFVVMGDRILFRKAADYDRTSTISGCSDDWIDRWVDRWGML
jgi:hypothetical protein